MEEEIKTLPSGVQYKVIDGEYAGLVGNDADIIALTRAFSPGVTSGNLTGTASGLTSGNITETAPSAPTQTREDLVSALDEAVQTDTDSYKYSGDKTGKTVTFDNGSVLTQRGYVFEYEDADGNPIDLNLKPGLKQSVDSKNEALGVVVRGIKSDLTEDVYDEFGGKGSPLVSEYLADEAAKAEQQKRSEERKDEAFFGTIDTDVESDTFGQRTGGTMGALNEQVKREADALGISTDEFYQLGLPLRTGMAIADIGEVFDPSLGPLTVPYVRDDDPSSPTFRQVLPQIDLNNPRNLGTLGSENLAIYQPKAQDIIDKLTPYDPATMDPYSEMRGDIGGQFDYSAFNLGPSSMPVEGGVKPVRPPFESNLSNFNLDPNSMPVVPLEGGLQIPGTNIVITAPPPGSGPYKPPSDPPPVVPPVVAPPVVPPVVPPPVVPPVDPIFGPGFPIVGPGFPVESPIVSPEENLTSNKLTLDDVLVPSTVNYGTDPRFANLAPTFTVSKAAMPTFAGIGSLGIAPPPLLGTLPTSNKFNPPPLGGLPPYTINPDEEGSGVVSLAEGGTPKGQGIMPDFMVDSYLPSLIPQALAGSESARSFLLDAHSNFDNFTLPEELFLKIKYGRASGGIASLNDTARNMFRPMVG